MRVSRRLLPAAALALPAVLGAASNKTCVAQTMCITATVDATTTLYEVESINSIPPGWMAIGWGKKMAGSPMIVMWANADGTVTLSPREGTGHVQPTVSANPARVPTLSKSQTNVKADNPVIAFTVPNAEGAALTQQDLIWAMSLQAPSGSQSYATLQYHDAGFGNFALSIPASSASGGTSASTTNSPSTSTSSSTAAAATSTAAGSPAAGTTGGRTCVGDPQVLCITATVNSTTTVYSLTSVASTAPGYVALGFGEVMAGAPMVLLWKDPNGGIVISQRTATGHVMPTPVEAPPRTAIVDAVQSSPLSSQPVFTFSIPSSGSASSQQLIWAAASASPDSASPNATVKFHDLGFGSFILDASSPLTSSGAPTDTTAGKQVPLTKSQKFIVVHAVLFTIALLVLLPFGALVARLMRTSVPWWFKVHWIVQFYITFPIMVIAFAFSVAAVGDGPHFSDFHMKLGLAIFVLYFAQCALGAFVHFVKSPNRRRRPGQNYLHAIAGLTIIGLSIAQVRSGYAHEWNESTGRGPVGGAVNVLWIVWVVALPVLYFGGLALLPRQHRQEREARDSREKRAMSGSDDL